MVTIVRNELVWTSQLIKLLEGAAPWGESDHQKQNRLHSVVWYSVSNVTTIGRNCPSVASEICSCALTKGIILTTAPWT